MTRQRPALRVLLWSSAVVCIGAAATLVGQLAWGMDHFLMGWDASTELSVRIRPVTSDLRLTIYAPTNPYASGTHEWMFFHLRGDVMRHVSPSGLTVTHASFLFFGRHQRLSGGKVLDSHYWMVLPGTLLVALASGSVVLAILWSSRRSDSARGFPITAPLAAS